MATYCDMGPAISVPPYTPVSRPIRVMPNCTAENILFGFSRSFRTIFADLLPSSAMASSRG